MPMLHFGKSIIGTRSAGRIRSEAEKWKPVDQNDRVTYTYNRQGKVTTKTDQNGTAHSYSYDSLGGRLPTP